MRRGLRGRIFPRNTGDDIHYMRKELQNMVGVIDYKAGNGPSVHNALAHMGIEAVLTGDRDELAQCSHIILPGVGSAGATMDSLKELGLISVMEEHVFNKKKPFIGICVGLQVLFERSEEDNANCLGWLDGEVVRFKEDRVRVPQIGWNSAKFTREDKILEGLQAEEYFYFVNSYHICPKNESDALAYTDYGTRFCSMINRDNIYATQFHIEKSGEVGLKLLKNFTQL